MLGEELPLTVTIVLTLLVANVVGGIAAFLLAAHLARVVLVRATVLVPVILSVVLIGAVQASRQWEDMGFPIAIGLVGWVMKRVRWSRSPLVLAFILVPLVEQYYFISMWLHGWRWLLEPAVAVILVATAILLVVLGVRGFRSARARLADGQRRALRPALDADAVTAVAVCAVSALAQVTAGDRAASARAIPQLVAASSIAALAAHFGAFVAGFAALACAIAVLRAITIFILAWMLTAGESWRVAVPVAAATAIAAYLLFTALLSLGWPQPVHDLLRVLS